MKKIIIFFLLFALSINLAYASLTDGLVTYYNMDQTSGDILDTLGLCNMTNNGVELGSTGKINVSGNYDNAQSDYLEQQNVDCLNVGDGAFTISMWILEQDDGLAFAKDTNNVPGGNLTGYYLQVASASAPRSITFGTRQTGVGANYLDSGKHLTNNDWSHVVVTRNASGDKEIYIHNVSRATDNDGSLNVNLTNEARFGGSLTGNLFFDGKIDEFGFWNRDLSREEVSELYNNSFGMTYPFGIEPPASAVTVNTSIFAVDFNHTAVQFASSSYFNAFEFAFNTSTTDQYYLLSTFNILKLTTSTTSEIWGKVLVDDIEIKEELLRTVTGTGDEGSSGFFPVGFNLSSGQHNITYQFRRTVSGIIEINDIDIILIKERTLENETVRSKITDGFYSYSETDYSEVFNFSINTNAENIFVANKQTVTADTTASTDYRFINLNDNFMSNIVSRYLSDASDIGSIGNNWLLESSDIDEISLLSKTNAGTVTVNTSILDMDMLDTANNTINSFSVSNSSTNRTNTINLNAGKYILTNKTILNQAGEGILMSSTISFQSTTGTQTPTFVMNTTDSTLDCYSKRERYLSSNDDIGNVFYYHICNSNITTNTTYDFLLWVEVETGETLTILDEVLTGFEVTILNITEIDKSPTMEILTDLINNTNFFNEDTIGVNYNFTVGDFNTFNIANCSLLVDDVVELTQNDRNETTNYLFNYTIPILEKNVSFEVLCSNNDGTFRTGEYIYDIDTTLPAISLCNSVFNNNTIYTVLDTLTFCFNVTDNNLIAYNFTEFDESDTVLRNLFAENLTVSTAENQTSKFLDTTGVFRLRVEAWDSHTRKKLKYNPSLIGDNLYYNNVMFYCDDTKNMNYEKKKDKVKAKVETNQKKFKHTCYYEIINNGNFIKVPESNYNNHYIDFENQIWIDEIGIDHTSLMENNKKIKLTLNFDEETDSFETNSIGDLNYNNKIWYYSVSATPPLTVNLTELERLQNLTLQENVKQTEAIQMIWFWFVFVFAVIFPFAIKKAFLQELLGKENRDEFEHKHTEYNFAVIISVAIFVILLYFNTAINYFGFDTTLKNIMSGVLAFLMIAYIFAIETEI